MIIISFVAEPVGIRAATFASSRQIRRSPRRKLSVCFSFVATKISFYVILSIASCYDKRRAREQAAGGLHRTSSCSRSRRPLAHVIVVANVSGPFGARLLFNGRRPPRYDPAILRRRNNSRPNICARSSADKHVPAERNRGQREIPRRPLYEWKSFSIFAGTPKAIFVAVTGRTITMPAVAVPINRRNLTNQTDVPR